MRCCLRLYRLKIYLSIKQNEYTRMIDILSVRYFGLINSVLVYREVQEKH